MPSNPSRRRRDHDRVSVMTVNKSLSKRVSLGVTKKNNFSKILQMKKLPLFMLFVLFYSSVVHSQNRGVIERAEPVIYAITSDGKLNWYKHIGYTADIETRDEESVNSEGTYGFEVELMKMLGAKTVGTGGWQYYKFAFSNRTTIYGVTADGNLNWYKHTGGEAGTTEMEGAVAIGIGGWQSYKLVFAGGNGIIYAITTNGNLNWYKHTGASTGSTEMQGAITIGSGGWQHYKSVFTSGNGIIYAITPDGNLNWYKHSGYLTGTDEMEGAITIDRSGNWGNYKFVFAYEDIIYAISNAGNLYFYRYPGYQTGRGKMSRYLIGKGGWNNYLKVFSGR